MSTIEELLEQKKQIEQQIRIMRNKEYIHGGAKLGTHHYPRGDEWYIAVKSVVASDLGESRWRAIITCKTREAAISKIDEVLNDLNGLKDILTKEKMEDK